MTKRFQRISGYGSLVIAAILIAIIILAVGKPEPEQNLNSLVHKYIEELYKVSLGSDGDKAHFLSQGFCFDDTLENLAMMAQSPEEVLAVDSLGKDCVVLASRLQEGQSQ